MTFNDLTDDQLRHLIEQDIRNWPKRILLYFVIDNYDLLNCDREMLLSHAEDLLGGSDPLEIELMLNEDE
jgi:hypothetical protein